MNPSVALAITRVAVISAQGIQLQSGMVTRLMKNKARHTLNITLKTFFIFLAGAAVPWAIYAQSPEVQQRVSQIKESSAKNKQALASYSWNEQVTISLKGQQKKVQHFQVRLGPDLTPQKTSLDPPADPPSGGRLKRRVVAKKTEEYTGYANQMKALAQQYVPPDGILLQQAYARGNVVMGPTGSAPNQIQLVIHNYLKTGDSMTLVLDTSQKQLLQVQITSYMNDPKDAMNLTVQFSRLPDGTNHVSNLVIDGVSKQMNIAIQNSNYQHV